MYIVLPQGKQYYSSLDIIHLNSAPLSQNLTGKEVFYYYDEISHVIAKTDNPIIPDYFFIDGDNIQIMSTREKVENGIIVLSEYQKLNVNGEIVELNLEELVNDGLATSEQRQDLRDYKIRLLRDTRDQLLNQTDWITSRMSKEDKGVALGLISDLDRKWTNQETADYLIWCKIMTDLPDTITSGMLDAMKLEEITADNTAIFQSCPLDTALTKLPGE